ncbi:MAG: AgmX/PglI C-terminal domain-containing protein, partial [Myxococcaceae bacterium]|nr:AgmX/PglI C-terminal domain-containing protein [Myxococcaceae bacterium]
DDVAGKVVADNLKAFNTCIENALRRNPNLQVGAVNVSLNVGPSGAVKSVAISPKQHEGTDWGACMMGAGKRIVFPASDGETEVQIPLKVGVAL